MKFLEVVLLLFILYFFCNAFRHYKGFPKKGIWTGYSVGGSLYAGVSFSALLLSFHIEDFTGIFYLLPVFLSIHLFSMFYAMKIERDAEAKRQ